MYVYLLGKYLGYDLFGGYISGAGSEGHSMNTVLDIPRDLSVPSGDDCYNSYSNHRETMGKWWFNGILWDLTSGCVKIAIQTGDRQFMSFPIKNRDFPVRYVTNCQRV